MELNKGVNMVVHEDEIKRRPRRTWFQTEDEKNAVKLASLAAARGAGRKKPIDLDATPAADADADAAAAAAAGEEGTGEVASERNAMTFREVREKLKEQKKAAKPQAAAKRPMSRIQRRRKEAKLARPRADVLDEARMSRAKSKQRKRKSDAQREGHAERRGHALYSPGAKRKKKKAQRQKQEGDR